MAMPLWAVDLIKKTFPGIFTVARLTRVPGLGRAIDRALFKGDDIMYLPKDKVIELKAPVSLPGDLVLPSRVVDHFIEQANYHWLMDACICREASACRDYPVGLGCLFLGEAAMKINPGLGRPVSRDQARAHARRCREAGLVHLIGRNKLDTVWLGVGPGTRLLTICNCCPCCCLWRVIPHLDRDISRKISRMPGVMVRVNDNCTGCGECLDGVCFVGAIRLLGDRALIGASCRGCGRCVEACPHQAIEIEIKLPGSVQDSIERISPLVDVS